MVASVGLAGVAWVNMTPPLVVSGAWFVLPACFTGEALRPLRVPFLAYLLRFPCMLFSVGFASVKTQERT